MFGFPWHQGDAWQHCKSTRNSACCISCFFLNILRRVSHISAVCVCIYYCFGSLSGNKDLKDFFKDRSKDLKSMEKRVCICKDCEFLHWALGEVEQNYFFFGRMGTRAVWIAKLLLVLPISCAKDFYLHFVHFLNLQAFEVLRLVD